MNENQNTEQGSTNIEWEQLWEVTKRWAVMSQFESDLDHYEFLKKHYNENVYI
jgi:hypothetical protein